LPFNSAESATSSSIDSSTPAPEKKDVVVFGIRLRYLHQPCVAAAPGGPPLVLLHGLLGYSFCWRRNLAALSRYAEVYAPDLPGMGFSDRPRDFYPTAPEFARIGVGFCDALGLTSFDLGGTSHGAAVAMLMAAQARTRVRRLVLNAPVNPWSWGNEERIAKLSTRAGALSLRLCYPFLLRKGKYFLDQLYCDPQRVPADALEGYRAALRLPGTAKFLLRTLPGWRADLEAVRRALPAIASIPTLLLWGAADTVIAAGSAEPMAREFERAEVRLIPASGHMPYEETPEEFNRAVIDFLYRSAAIS
jgi:pimeloyl-ACP methyl ester carboxylesterase